MSLTPGLPGQKTDLFDGAKIDVVSEYTVGNGVQLQGRTNGVAIAAGLVGELTPGGSQRSVTYGFTYSVRTSTNVTGTTSELAAITLKKGLYLVSFSSTVRQDSGSARDFIYSLAVEGSSITNDNTVTTGTTIYAPVAMVVPVYINTDDKKIQLVGRWSPSVTGTAGGHEMWAVRIA